MSKEKMYPYDFEWADVNGELDLWKKSEEENFKCSKALSTLMTTAYSNNRLDCEQVYNAICRMFDKSRISYILATTVNMYSHDGRISYMNKEWARKTANGSNYEHTLEQAIHVGLIDLFATYYRRKEGE